MHALESRPKLGWRRRLLGANGVAVAWVLLWTPLGALLGPLLDVYRRLGDPPHHWIPELSLMAAIGAILGYLSGWVYGALFALLLGVFERGRTLATLPAWRVAIWGALPGLLFGAIPLSPHWDAGMRLVTTALWAVPGACTACVALWLARRSPGDA